MRDRLASLAAATLIGGSVAGCGFLPPTPEQHFAVTGGVPQAEAMFRVKDPAVEPVLSEGYCAGGFENEQRETIPSSDGPITVQHIRCKAYSVDLLPF